MPALPSVPRQPRKLPGAPPRETIERCMRAASGWLRAAIALAYFGTQRNGEVRATRVMDVDFADNGLKIRHAFSHPELSVPKGKDERAVPMGPCCGRL